MREIVIMGQWYQETNYEGSFLTSASDEDIQQGWMKYKKSQQDPRVEEYMIEVHSATPVIKSVFYFDVE